MIRNNFIKAFCFGLAFCLLLTGFNICFAEETAEPDWDVKEEQGGFSWLVNTPEEYIFSEEGSPRKFVLLDITDDPESRFFVLADEYYIDRAYDSNGKTLFDPDDGRNLGGWLNGSFFKYGNTVNSGETMIIPKGMREYINQNHVWITDGQPAPTPELGTYGIGVMSKEEAYKYHDKFGVDSGLKTSVLYTNTYGWWVRSQPDTNTSSKLCWRFDPEKGTHIHAWNSKVDGIAVRPCFYLSEDYFKNVRISMTGMGSAVKEAIKKVYLKDDLLNAYSEDEVQDLFGYKASVNISITEWTDENGKKLESLKTADYVNVNLTAQSFLPDANMAVMMVLYGEDNCPITFAVKPVKVCFGQNQKFSVGMKLKPKQKENGAYIKTYIIKAESPLNAVSNAVRTYLK